MGGLVEPANANLIETATEPEYFVTTLVKADHIGENVRLYFATNRGSLTRLEFTAVASAQDWLLLAKQIVLFVSHQGNLPNIPGLN